MKAATKEAFQLIHQGSLALSKVEHVGIRVDEDKLQANIAEAAEEIAKRESRMMADPLWKRWKRRFGEKANLGARPQLGTLLFEELGYKCPNRTETGKFKVDEAALQVIDLPFIEDYIWWQKYSKAKDTFLSGIEREVCDGLLHAIYNLNIVATFRSSSDSPNFQNLPIRDPVLGKLIRSIFIPRKNHILMEVDFKGIEVRVAACYHKDPVMMEYIKDETKDMHRDMAAQCYSTDPNDVSKEMRYCGKNQFVFPEFYGDWYLSCAKALWESILKMSLKTKSGIPVGEHLARKGIRELGACIPGQKPKSGTFEAHLKKVEDDFWGRRFKVYKEWKEEWYAAYTKQGWFQMYTGFICSGVMSRNDVINYPVQGAAFHLLLWSLIQLQKWMIKNKMRSLIVGQIHDSLLLDVHKREVEDVYHKAEEIMTVAIKTFAPWLIVKLEIETESSETNWHEKKPFSLAV